MNDITHQNHKNRSRTASLSNKIRKISIHRDSLDNDSVKSAPSPAVVSQESIPVSSESSEPPSLREEPVGSSARSRGDGRESTNGEEDFGSTKQMSAPLLTELERARERKRSKSVNTARVTIGTKPCLLGPGGTLFVSRTEARAIFPDDFATIFCATWNVSTKAPTKFDTLKQWLLPSDCQERVDVYAISLQEVASLDMCLHQGIISHIEQVLGRAYLPYLWVRKFGQMLIVFIRRSLLPFCTDPEYHFVPSEVVAKPSKTKGAIGALFRLMHVSFLFVGCHLSYGPKCDRIRDYHKISQALQFARTRKHHSESCCNTAVCCSDNVFWFGDLNFSVDSTPNGVTDFESVARLIGIGGQIIGERAINSVLMRDQLINEMKHGTIFERFEEPKILFHPTYKYKHGTSNYNSTRIPSYTDRVLYRNNTKSPEAIQPILYNCVYDECMSDHKPVYAVFKVRVVPEQKLPQQFESQDTETGN